MFRREFWKNFDFWLIGAVLFLCVFGLIMIQSTIAGNIELANYMNRQATFLGIGIAVLITVSLINYRYWKSFSRFLYIFILAFLGIILIIGTTSFGAQRWLEVGLINIQPAEIAKIVLILVLAHYFSSQTKKPKDIRWMGLSGLLVAGIVVPIYLQPNLSTTILLVVIWISMLWISGIPTKYVYIIAVIGVIGAVLLFPNLEPYQQNRILSFINPDENASYGNDYNVQQALITIGSGGLLGQGYGSATQVQLRFLKVRSTDFIFSAIAAEFGFVGTIVIMAILIFVIVRCIRAARIASDPYGSLIAYGFATLIAFQTMVNIGVNLRVIPVTGQTLPFISYGGSSLLSLMLGIGLIESVLLHRKA